MRRPEFGAYVEELAAGRSNRDMADITQVSHSRIGDMRGGFVPTYRLLQRFADNMEPALTPEQRRELFRRAGFLFEESRDEPTDPLEHFNRRYGDLCRRHGRPIPYPASYMGGKFILRTRENADDLIAAMEESIEKGEL